MLGKRKCKHMFKINLLLHGCFIIWSFTSTLSVRVIVKVLMYYNSIISGDEKLHLPD